MAADLALVADAAERDADELTARGAGDRLAERGLAHARGANEAEDRPLQLLRALLDGEVFDDTFLDLLEPVMIGVEHLLGVVQILLDARLGAPRDRQHPVEVIAHDGGLGRHRRHVLELLELALGLFARLFRQLGLGDAGFELGDLVLALVVLAEFLLDRLHLFVEVIFALGPLHLRLHAGLDLFLDLQDRHFALHQPVDLLEPLVDREGFEQFLFLRHLDAEVTGDEIGELGGLVGVGDGRERFLGDVLLDLRVALEFLVDRAGQRLGGGRVAHGLVERDRLGLEELGVLDEAGDLHPFLALDQHFHGAVGELEELEHVGEHADAVDRIGLGIVHRGVDLAGQQDLLVVRHDLFERLHALIAADEQRNDHVREHHDIAQRQNGVGEVLLLGHFFSLCSADSPAPTFGCASRLLFAFRKRGARAPPFQPPASGRIVPVPARHGKGADRTAPDASIGRVWSDSVAESG